MALVDRQRLLAVILSFLLFDPFAVRPEKIFNIRHY